MYLIPMKY